MVDASIPGGAGIPDTAVTAVERPSRRPFAAADLLRLLIGVVVVVAGALVASSAQSTVSGIEADLARAFGRLPDTLGTLLVNLAQLATSLIPTVALVVLLVRRRWKVALLLLLTAALARYAMVLADLVLVDRSLSDILAEIDAAGSTTTSAFPDSTVIASSTAVVTVAAPWLTRRWKQTLWWGIGALVALRLVAVTEPAFDLVLALGVGTIVGTLVLLVFGTPTTVPDAAEVVAALRTGGFRPRELVQLADRRGALRYRTTDDDGTHHLVTLRTPDERDSEALQRLYRSLRYQSSEVGRPYATLKRRIEHEALALAMADRADVRAPSMERVATTDGGSALLVTGAAPEGPATAEQLTDRDVLADLWTQIDRLHRAGVAHRALALEAIALDDRGRVWLDEFDDAQTAPNDRELARDVAILLTETALVVGAERAVAAAVDVLGPDQVAPSLRMLQPLALPPTTRTRAKAADGLLEELRTEVNAATGEPGVELEELERLKPRTVLIVVASTLAFYTLLPQVANLQATVDAFGDANYWWLIGTLVASAVTYLFAAISFQGAVADRLPFAANLRVQLAAAFTGLVGPAGAGGFALTGRFLQRAGVAPAEAGASVAVNAIAGFAVHLVLMVGFILWAGSSAVDGFSLPDSQTILLVVAGVLALLGILVAIGPVRRRVVRPAIAQLRTGLAQIGRVFRSPGRVAALFGGSTGISITYVVAVATTVEAFGGGITFAQIGAAYLVAVAIATLAPTPGGLGALESAMIAGLSGFGLDAGVAVSATLTFRLATFWLPILPGWVTFGWMQRNDEV
ncbi:MAG: flippase-like domain-containing protein [Acidimicrobiales bacterium]|nr:flippase-like domain-containing protein [Acidimicrobiales bacterium]